MSTSGRKIILIIACLIQVTSLQQIIPLQSNDAQTEKPSNHRIVGGTDASLGEFPWQGLMYVRGTAICGCSLLDMQWVITAAHCTEGLSPSEISVRLGLVDTSAPESTATTHSIESIHDHSEYNTRTLENDISLLKLSDTVTFNNVITPISLPTQGEDAIVGTNCLISGWGTLMENTANFPSVLQKATVPILDDNLCQSWYGSVGVTIYGVQMCAGVQNGGVDTCQGDSGGPLACQNTGSYVLQGITSFGVGCARQERPGVYTRVSDYVTWIDTITSSPTLSSGQLQTLPTNCFTHVMILSTILWNTLQ